MDVGRGVVMSWPWGSATYTNTVVALLYWRGGLGALS